VVEQGLLQIKAVEQRERQLALATWHQTLAAAGCGAWPPSAPVAAAGAPANARDNLGGG
jgi:hypothetical protein